MLDHLGKVLGAIGHEERVWIATDLQNVRHQKNQLTSLCFLHLHPVIDNFHLDATSTQEILHVKTLIRGLKYLANHFVLSEIGAQPQRKLVGNVRSDDSSKRDGRRSSGWQQSVVEHFIHCVENVQHSLTVGWIHRHCGHVVWLHLTHKGWTDLLNWISELENRTRIIYGQTYFNLEPTSSLPTDFANPSNAAWLKTSDWWCCWQRLWQYLAT